MENLQFLNTFSIADFKTEQGITSVDILQNNETGKCFFAFGVKSGAVTTTYPKHPLTNPVISEVYSGNTGKAFYLLHNKGECKALKLESF